MWERKILEDTATHCDREREAEKVRGEGGRIGALVLVPVAGREDKEESDICIYMYIYVNIYIYVYICVYIYMYLHTYMCERLYFHAAS